MCVRVIKDPFVRSFPHLIRPGHLDLQMVVSTGDQLTGCLSSSSTVQGRSEEVYRFNIILGSRFAC